MGVPKLTCKPRSVPAFWKGLTLQKQFTPCGFVLLAGRRRSSISTDTLPCGSSSLPEAGRAEPARTHWVLPHWDSPLFGLAPDGGCLAVDIAADAGGLLHHPFTLAAGPESSAAIFFSVALFRQVAPPRELPGV